MNKTISKKENTAANNV